MVDVTKEVVIVQLAVHTSIWRREPMAQALNIAWINEAAKHHSQRSR